MSFQIETSVSAFITKFSEGSSETVGPSERLAKRSTQPLAAKFRSCVIKYGGSLIPYLVTYRNNLSLWPR